MGKNNLSLAMTATTKDPVILDKLTDIYLSSDLKRKYKDPCEYPILSCDQMRRRRRREVSCGDFSYVQQGSFYRIDPVFGRAFNQRPKEKRKYFYNP